GCQAQASSQATGLTQPSSASPASPTPSASPASPTPSASPSSSAKTVLGPTGFGTLALGMTKAAARATGLVTGMDASDKGTCGSLPGEGRLLGAPSTSAFGYVTFSDRSSTLVAIIAYPGLQTPEGIELGSSYEQVHAAYPAWKGTDEPYTSGRGLVAVPR